MFRLFLVLGVLCTLALAGCMGAGTSTTVVEDEDPVVRQSDLEAMRGEVDEEIVGVYDYVEDATATAEANAVEAATGAFNDVVPRVQGLEAQALSHGRRLDDHDKMLEQTGIAAAMAAFKGGNKKARVTTEADVEAYLKEKGYATNTDVNTAVANASKPVSVNVAPPDLSKYEAAMREHAAATQRYANNMATQNGKIEKMQERLNSGTPISRWINHNPQYFDGVVTQKIRDRDCIGLKETQPEEYRWVTYWGVDTPILEAKFWKDEKRYFWQPVTLTGTTKEERRITISPLVPRYQSEFAVPDFIGPDVVKPNPPKQGRSNKPIVPPPPVCESYCPPNASSYYRATATGNYEVQNSAARHRRIMGQPRSSSVMTPSAGM